MGLPARSAAAAPRPGGAARSCRRGRALGSPGCGGRGVVKRARRPGATAAALVAALLFLAATVGARGAASTIASEEEDVAGVRDLTGLGSRPTTGLPGWGTWDGMIEEVAPKPGAPKPSAAPKPGTAHTESSEPGLGIDAVPSGTAGNDSPGGDVPPAGDVPSLGTEVYYNFPSVEEIVDAPVQYWPMNDTDTNSTISVNVANPKMPMNVVGYPPRTGNNGYLFNSTGLQFMMMTMPMLQSTTFELQGMGPGAITAWVTLPLKSECSTDQTVVAFGPDDGNGVADSGILLHLYLNNLNNWVLSGGAVVNGQQHLVDTVIRLEEIGRWAHLGLVHDDTSQTWHLYVNGTIRAKAYDGGMGFTMASGEPGNSTWAIAGCHCEKLDVNAPLQNLFNGLIRDLRVYRTALSEEAIRMIMNQTVGSLTYISPYLLPSGCSDVLPGVPPMPPSQPTPTPPPPAKRSWLAWMLVATALVGVLALVVVALVLYLALRRRRRQQQQYTPDSATGGKREAKSSSWSLFSLSVFRRGPLGRRDNGGGGGSGPGSAASAGSGGSDDLLDSETRRSKALALPTNALWRVFESTELAKATDGFSPDRKLGSGGFGDVFLAVLEDGSQVAVKRLRSNSMQGENEFRAEVDTLSRCKHRNLVSLLGSCYEESTPMLVFEFVSGGSLDVALHKSSPPLSWDQRMKIAQGTARALAYLHNCVDPPIIHRDLKPSNILISSADEAKVADFGLARELEVDKTHVSTLVMGSFGFVDPVYMETGRLTAASDVYSFGIVLLEMITGRFPVDMRRPPSEQRLAPWARRQAASPEVQKLGFLDPQMPAGYQARAVLHMFGLAMQCIGQEPDGRPTMAECVTFIDDVIEATELQRLAMCKSETASGCATPPTVASAGDLAAVDEAEAPARAPAGSDSPPRPWQPPPPASSVTTSSVASLKEEEEDVEVEDEVEGSARGEEQV